MSGALRSPGKRLPSWLAGFLLLPHTIRPEVVSTVSPEHPFTCCSETCVQRNHRGPMRATSADRACSEQPQLTKLTGGWHSKCNTTSKGTEGQEQVNNIFLKSFVGGGVEQLLSARRSTLKAAARVNRMLCGYDAVTYMTHRGDANALSDLIPRYRPLI